MKLLLDIGNSTIVIACADENLDIVNTWHFKTVKSETISFYRNELRSGLRRFGIIKSDDSLSSIKEVVISSVVPEINDKVSQAVLDVTGVTPRFLSLDDITRIMPVNVESPSQIGRDRLGDAVGALTCYGAPAIVFDLGTATTVGIINDEGVFVGGMIIPGVKTALNALSARASQLPVVNIEEPQHLIGRNTVECMQSGILYGTAAMIDGLIDRFLPMFHNPVNIVATGGMAKRIVPFCNHPVIVEEFLQLKGLIATISKYSSPSLPNLVEPQ